MFAKKFWWLPIILVVSLLVLGACTPAQPQETAPAEEAAPAEEEAPAEIQLLP